MANSTQPELLVQDDAGIKILTLNRPHAANALNPPLLQALRAAIVEAGKDRAIRTIVITAAGERVFCAGADFKAAVSSDENFPGSVKPMDGLERNLFEIMLETPQPIIAAINGTAAGGGFELALACDLRLAAPHARFLLPEAKRGMGAHFASIMLPRIIPNGIALEMLFTGTPIDAPAALQWGLLNRIVPADTCLAEAMALARTIAGNAPLSLRRIKAHARKSQGMPIAAALRLDDGPSPYESEDRIEGARAFLEKRPPIWQGR